MCPRKSTGKNTRSDIDTLSAIDILRIYERIVSVTEDRLAFVDRDYIYRAANESYLRAFSKKREEVIGHTVAEVRGEKDFKETLKKYLDQCLNGERVRYQAWFKLPDLGDRYLDVAYDPFYESESTISGVVVSSRDMTDRKNAEDAYAKQLVALAKADELQKSRQRIIAVQEYVRKDIAQQLHGTVQNRLIVVMNLIAQLEKETQQQEALRELADIRDKINDLLEQDIRSISRRLYPAILHQGLVPALQSLGDTFETILSVDVIYDEGLWQRERNDRNLIKESLKWAVYRIAEEALNRDYILDKGLIV